MLVFKDTIEGLVAGIRLTSADMVHVGDWITVPSANANGTVIEMNLTTVKIQNFDKTITTVSPTTLVNGSFQNWKGMQESEGGRRVTRKLYIDFRSIHFVDGNTADQPILEGKPLMVVSLICCSTDMPWRTICAMTRVLMLPER